MKKTLFACILLFGGLLGAKAADFKLTSEAYKQGTAIPAIHSRLGKNISPPLSWSGVPKNTKSFVIMMIDYDAKESVGHPVIHWVIYDIPPDVHALAMGEKDLKEGLNSYHLSGYIGMNPPRGKIHKYYTYIYALDIVGVPIHENPTVSEVLGAIKGHIIGKACLMGTYRKPLSRHRQ